MQYIFSLGTRPSYTLWLFCRTETSSQVGKTVVLEFGKARIYATGFTRYRWIYLNLPCWPDGECSQVIVLPAISVWAVSTMPNGDIVTGSSDGIVRVFTNSEERWADAEDLKVANLHLTNFNISLTLPPRNTMTRSLHKLYLRMLRSLAGLSPGP